MEKIKMDNDPRGTMIQQGNIMRINNALVEEVVCSSNTNGYMVVSYSDRDANRGTVIRNIRLNFNRNTVALNMFGERQCLCCIQPGTWVNAVFSAQMTRSIPPQSNALVIVTQRRPQASTSTTVDRIMSVDRNGNILMTGDPRDINSQMQFVLTNTTTYRDRFGRLVGINALRPGQLVRITHANFQTASIPPQTTAFSVQIL